MVKYELSKVDNGTYFYHYYPDGDYSAPGLITIDQEGNRGIVSISKNDVKNIYAGFVWRFFSNNPKFLGRKSGEIVMF